MKPTIISQPQLARGLSIVSRAVSPRSTLPVLANVLLRAEDGKLTLQATNLEIGITTWAPCEVGEAWALTVPARLMTDLVGTLPGEPVQLTPNLGTCTLTVKCGKSSTDIKGIDAQDFPPMPKTDADGVAVKVTDFKRMVEQVGFAASTDEGRPALQGVNVIIGADGLSLAATDGFRVSVRKLAGGGDPKTLLIPAKALAEWARIADGALMTLITPPGGAQVILRGETVEMTSQLIDGRFPDFNAIVPKSFKTRATVSTAQLLMAIRQAELIARNANNVVRLHLTGDALEVSATSEDTGQNSGTVAAEVYGPGLTIAFNVSYLRQALEAAKAASVVLEANDSKGPARLTAQGDEGWFVVMMPMALG
jgi:DNA polymerase-3 subunit beta